MDNMHREGFVSLVGAGPGDPGLITLRAAECLAQADVVVYDRLANPLLLRIAPQAEWLPVGKQPNHHPVPQEEINAILIEQARQGKRVVRLKGGDPFIFGRGGEEALALAQAGIHFEIVPGVTSAIAVPAYAGIPLTHRDVACSTALITGHRAEWIENPEDDWQRCSLGADTLVFLMGVKNLPRIVSQLLEAGRPESTPVALVEQGTTTAQKTITGTLADIVTRAAGIRPPAVIIVGEVVRLREQLGWYDSASHRPLFGLRVLNTKSFPNREAASHPLGMFPMDEFDRQVYTLGGEAVHMPVIQVCPPQDPAPMQAAIQRLVAGSSYDWVVFTSTNAVTAFFDQLGDSGYDARVLRDTRLAAIGSATGQSLQQRSIQADFLPSQSSGAILGEEIPVHTRARVLLPRSEIGLPDLPQALIARGAQVDDVPAYSVRTARPDQVVLEQLLAGDLNVVAFFSPSGIEGLAHMLAAAGYDTPLPEVLAPLNVACIGPSTTKAARAMGLTVEITAQEYTSTGLVQAMVIWRQHS